MDKKTTGMGSRKRTETASASNEKELVEVQSIYSAELIADDLAEGLPDATPPQLSHYDQAGDAHMVDVSAKQPTRREAVARAFVELSDIVLAALPQNPKGNPLEVARFAGIQAAKKTSDLIPMCHPLALSFVDVTASVVEGGIAIEATAATVAGTGVEMEAMVAASVAALTVYDMTKALDKGIRIRDVILLRKSGGKSGDYRRNETPDFS
jgi:cyclic pyranopterin phosphate synthase